MLPKPMCCNPDCAQMLFIEDEEWKSGPMGEQMLMVECPECKTEQRVERFVEVNYMSFAQQEEEEKEEEVLTSEEEEG